MIKARVLWHPCSFQPMLSVEDFARVVNIASIVTITA